VPFAIWGEGIEAASGSHFTEAYAEASEVEVGNGWELMSEFIGSALA
jgi:hypothetical protein